MTLSDVFSPVRVRLGRDLTEISVPAKALHEFASLVPRRMSVDIHSTEELAAALRAGVHPGRMTVHAAALTPEELTLALDLVPGRVVVGSAAVAESVGSTGNARLHNVFARVPDGDGELVRAIVGNDRLRLIGVYGSADDFASFPTAVIALVAEMAQVRRDHGLLLTRLGLRVRGAELADVTRQAGEAVEDACVALRFPRPLVTLAPMG
jgi:diaminopimelate decarboxylase